uniref:NADH-ubiquinone oxidoreductase chain 1 n=1 Tax=Solen strictus TaxID=194331 RepID=H9M5V0_9BIVA|nr:NADH dehydrogenase subunit 1 [Solen strictus]AER38717.1 NADH dehydrogenase subunit 1 [Solen strictus]
MICSVLCMVVTSVLFLVGVAFFIVTERKGLGMVQLRQGPNKVGLKGVVQPVSDGVKLFTKGWTYPASSNKFLFLAGPFVCFFISFLGWLLFPSSNPAYFFGFSTLFFLSLSCLNVYGIILVGWSSNSQYALLGCMRAVAQSLSYELVMSTILICPLLFFGSFELFSFRESGLIFGAISLEVGFIWLICVLAETNRAPFDFVEGESELVSGYNVEFGGFGFALIALAEYGSILLMSLVSFVLFFGGLCGLGLAGNLMMSFGVVFISYVIVCVRGSYPRFRYDMLMEFCWKCLLPLCIGILIVFLAILVWA